MTELVQKLEHNYFLLKLFTSLGKGENLSWVLGEFIAQINQLVLNNIFLLRSAQFWAITKLASIVFPNPTSSARITPLDKGFFIAFENHQ